MQRLTVLWTKRILRPGQESVEWMIHLVSRFCKVRELLLNTCDDALETAKGCLQLPKHRRSILCEKYYESVQHTQPSLVEEYARQVLSLATDIAGSEKADKISKVVLKWKGALGLWIWADSWTVSVGFVSVRAIPVSIMHFLAILYKDMISFKKCRQIPLW